MRDHRYNPLFCIPDLPVEVRDDGWVGVVVPIDKDGNIIEVQITKVNGDGTFQARRYVNA